LVKHTSSCVKVELLAPP